MTQIYIRTLEQLDSSTANYTFNPCVINLLENSDILKDKRLYPEHYTNRHDNFTVYDQGCFTGIIERFFKNISDISKNINIEFRYGDNYSTTIFKLQNKELSFNYDFLLCFFIDDLFVFLDTLKIFDIIVLPDNVGTMYTRVSNFKYFAKNIRKLKNLKGIRLPNLYGYGIDNIIIRKALKILVNVESCTTLYPPILNTQDKLLQYSRKFEYMYPEFEILNTVNNNIFDFIDSSNFEDMTESERKDFINNFYGKQKRFNLLLPFSDKCIDKIRSTCRYVNEIGIVGGN